MSKSKLAKLVMLLAAIYNIGWGIIFSIDPQLMLFGNSGTPFVLILIRCIAMLVGTYGIAYYFAAADPIKYWPLILVGFIGKVLGPIGSAYYISEGVLPAKFLYINVFNDLIWLVPFGWILWQVRRQDIANS